MKSSEFSKGSESSKISTEIQTDMEDPKKRLISLKSEIEAGLAPIVHNSSWGENRSVYYMGDLENLGWMSKTYTHDSSGEVDGWTRYYSHNAPGPIRVKTSGEKDPVLWNPGHEEEA